MKALVKAVVKTPEVVKAVVKAPEVNFFIKSFGGRLGPSPPSAGPSAEPSAAAESAAAEPSVRGGVRTSAASLRSTAPPST